MTIRFGAHSHSSDPLDWATDLGTNVLQFYVGDPQAWKKPAFPIDDLAERAAAEDIDLYVHAPYVVNVASTNNRVRIPSRKLLQQHVTEAARVGAKAVVVHGGHVTKDDNILDGFTNWRKAVDGLELPIPILIENTAGGAYAMARFLETLKVLWAALEGSDNFDNVGFCLDTCHAFASGLDMGTLVDDVLGITGRIDLVHLNDSKGAAGSGLDRHANLGQGNIGEEHLVAIAKQAGAPLVLETPGDKQGHVDDVAWLRARL
jgi:deoxyribonuclease IV